MEDIIIQLNARIFGEYVCDKCGHKMYVIDVDGKPKYCPFCRSTKIVKW